MVSNFSKEHLASILRQKTNILKYQIEEILILSRFHYSSI